MVEQNLPPHSLEAEQAVIGAALNSARAYDAAAERIAAEDFYREDHRVIWSALTAVVDAGQRPDLVTVTEALRRADDLGKAGGAAYLGDLATQGITESAATYADIVRDHAIRRNLIGVGYQVTELGFSRDGTPATDLVSEADGLLCNIARAGGKGGFQAPKEYVKAAVERLEHAYESGGEIVGLATGFRDLDRMTTGFRGGDLVVVAGRSSMGKSAFGFNIGRRVCDAGGRVAGFSGEMSAKDIADRMVSDVSGVPLGKIRGPASLEAEDWDPLTKGYAHIGALDFPIDDTSGLTIAEIRARARQKHRAGKLDAVIVDYLQLYRAPAAKSRENEVAEISRGLKALAKDLDCPVFALSQLNRDLEKRQDKRPRMSDLRESGAIEQDADVILFLYRDEVYDDHSPHKGVTEIIIGKQRNGPLGTVELAYLGDRTSFQPYTGPSFDEREADRPRKVRHMQFEPDRKSASAGDR